MVALTRINRKIRKLGDLHCYLNELDIRKQLLESYQAERVRQSIMEQCPNAENQLIERLWKANLTGETLPALPLAPHAVVAWASGSVTEQEGQKALLSLLDSQALGNGAAVNRFRSWLKSKPPEALMDLWEDFTAARLSDFESSERQREMEAVLQQLIDIAKASGGVLGWGKICTAEQHVIDRVRRVYSSIG